MANFLKNISKYILGYIMLRAISFLLLPIYTNVFTKEEFGIYTLIFIFIAFAQFLYSYGMDASLMKFFSISENKKEIYTSIFVSLLVTSSIFSIMISCFSDFISILFLENVNYGYLFKIAAIILFFDSFSFRVLIIHRMEDKPYKYFIFSFVNVLVTFLANYYFIIILNIGISGAFYAHLFGSISIFLLSLPIIFNRVSIQSFSLTLLKKILLFGFPFLPSVIFQMIIDFSDRRILLYLTDIDTVGIYSPGCKIASILLFLISGFRLGWEPFFLKLTKNKKIIISQISNIFLFFIFTVLLFFILFIEPIIVYSNHYFSFSIIGENFWGSIGIIPILMFGYIFLALYHLQMPPIFYYNKTSMLPFFRFVGAISNIILNFLLIPRWGIHGAAFATSLSYLIMTLPMFIYTNNFFKINYNWNLLIVYSLLSILSYYLKLYNIINIYSSLTLFFIGLSFLFFELQKTNSLIKKTNFI